MKLVQQPFFWITLAYFVAAIPIGLLVGKLRGVDIREVGSGNIGATNAVRALGRAWGLPVFLLDVLKAWLPLWIATGPAYLGAHPEAATWIAATGLAAFCGHVFPIYLGFKGGKGVACACGIALIVAPLAAIASLVLYLQTLFLTRISALGSLTAATAMALFASYDTELPLPYRALIGALAGLIWLRHQRNIREIVSEAKAQKAEKKRAKLKADR